MALTEQPNQGMAHGNMGKGLVHLCTGLIRRRSRRAAPAARTTGAACRLAGGVGRDGATYVEALEHSHRYGRERVGGLFAGPQQARACLPRMGAGPAALPQHTE